MTDWKGYNRLAIPTWIDTTELLSIRLSPDGKQLHLKLRGDADQTIALTLPVNCLNAMLKTLPRDIEHGAVRTLDSWAMALADNGQDLILTLRTSEGRSASFVTKPSQVQGMATVATYGCNQRATSKTIH
jgi:hypothetical protein